MIANCSPSKCWVGRSQYRVVHMKRHPICLSDKFGVSCHCFVYVLETAHESAGAGRLNECGQPVDFSDMEKWQYTRDAYQHIPAYLMEQVYQHYATDFEAFGFTLEDYFPN